MNICCPKKSLILKLQEKINKLKSEQDECYIKLKDYNESVKEGKISINEFYAATTSIAERITTLNIEIGNSIYIKDIIEQCNDKLIFEN